MDTRAHAHLAAARISYDERGLLEADLAPTPLGQLQRWYDEVAAAGVVAEPNAVVVATVDGSGSPDARTVLLKGMDARGLAFFTHRTSAKGRQLAAAPVAALVLPWHEVQRQVRARGPVEPVPQAEVAAYFASRPWGSRIGAHASEQSAEAPGRELLEAAWRASAQRWPEDGSGGPVPVPASWGGYRVRPVEVEFWVGRASRLHDRLVYLPLDGRADPAAGPPALDDAAAWRVVRRQP